MYSTVFPANTFSTMGPVHVRSAAVPKVVVTGRLVLRVIAVIGDSHYPTGLFLTVQETDRVSLQLGILSLPFCRVVQFQSQVCTVSHPVKSFLARALLAFKNF